MVERELDALIQDVLDGVATPEESARLETRLREDPAARARHREVSQLFTALGRSRRFEAPPELKTRILRTLPAGAPGVRTLAPAPSGRQLRLAYVFAAGLAAGVIGAGALTGFWKAPSPAGPPVSGSMMPSPAVETKGSSAHWQVGQTEVDGRAWRVAGSRLAAFRVHGADTEIDITFDPAAFSWTTFRAAPRARRATLEPGRIVFGGTERGETLVEFRELSHGDQPLHVTVRSGAQMTAGELPAPPLAPAAR